MTNESWKQLLLSAAVVIATHGLVYLSAAFIAADFNPVRWDGTLRLIMVMVGWLSCGAALAAVREGKNQ